MVIFGLMVRSYGNNSSVIQLLFIRSSGFGLMYLSVAHVIGQFCITYFTMQNSRDLKDELKSTI